MTNYQLLYFPLRGRGQATRYFFVDNGIDFKEVNIRQDWAKTYKPQMPFGQSPLLKDGDFEVAQSSSIFRYLGRKHGLYPDDIKEAAKVDMITDHVEDIRGPYIRMIYQSYDTAKDEYVKTAIEKLGYVENLFKKWGTEYITSKISFADYNLFDILDDHVILSPTCLDTFPTLKAYYDRMASRPNLKKHRSTEQFKKMPINGNGKQ
ncbi:glutathione S-transferase P 1-like [Ruditapes philippinarum]|uniref:glutathione S-transferase P 1-like n=1 Tax=Ruditapes philippinarum TaxID=129788 RepID=UPI00295B5598|nr:glutathione S-transferase P 1-like [Ruditapes philippinarum]